MKTLKIGRTNKRIIVSFILVILVSFSVLIMGAEFYKTGILLFFTSAYSDLSGIILTRLVNLSSPEYAYQASNVVSLIDGKQYQLIVPFVAFPFVFTLLIILFILTRKYWLNTVIATGVIIFYILRTCLITWVTIRFHNTKYLVFLDLLDSIRYLPFYLCGLYILNNNAELRKSFMSFKAHLSGSFYLSIETVVFLILFTISLPRIVITLIDVNVLKYLSVITLNISHSSLAFFDIRTRVNGNIIFLDRHWVLLGYGCLGVGVITLFLLLVFCIRGNLINKMLFVILFLPGFIVINSLRIDLLILYFFFKWFRLFSTNEIHDIGNVLVYILSWGIWGVYYFKYQDSKINMTKPQ